MQKTILIIDDDDVLRTSIAKGLRNEKFTVLTAESAERGNEILARVSVDAIVLDRMMTGMDGLTFLATLRGRGMETPVIMLTALSGPENAIDGLAAGADDYLAKPFQLKELILRLRNISKRQEIRAKKQAMPTGLLFTDDEFFVHGKLFALSNEEKKLLAALTAPVGVTAAATPMVAKRLRMKLNDVLSDMDLVTVRGKGYKLISYL